MAEQEYSRLTFSRSRTVSGIVSVARSSLWLGRDHLLCIETSGYTETYKRFYFRDIQAITLRRTDRWIWVATVLCAIGLFLAWPALAWGRTELVVDWIFGILAAMFGAFGAVHLALGPTCIAQLRTAVQTEQLPSLNRLRKARNILARLRPLIEQAQGRLTPEELAARVRELADVPPVIGPSPSAGVPSPGFESGLPPRVA
jgi:hypothetical protein